MPVWLGDDEYRVVQAACARMIPSDDGPGATEAGVVDYIDGLLGAFELDPPRIWAGGPFSGRHGGDAGVAGGNRDLVGWRYIGFDGDVQPRGYPDDVVSGPA